MVLQPIMYRSSPRAYHGLYVKKKRKKRTFWKDGNTVKSQRGEGAGGGGTFQIPLVQRCWFDFAYTLEGLWKELCLRVEEPLDV